MKNKYKLILAAITTLFGVVSIANPIITNAGDNDKVGQSNYLPATKYWSVNDDVESFYTSTSSGSVKGLKGDELLEKLAEILEDNFRDKTGHKTKASPLQKPSERKSKYFFKSLSWWF